MAKAQKTHKHSVAANLNPWLGVLLNPWSVWTHFLRTHWAIFHKGLAHSLFLSMCVCVCIFLLFSLQLQLVSCSIFKFDVKEPASPCSWGAIPGLPPGAGGAVVPGAGPEAAVHAVGLRGGRVHEAEHRGAVCRPGVLFFFCIAAPPNPCFEVKTFH